MCVFIHEGACAQALVAFFVIVGKTWRITEAVTIATSLCTQREDAVKLEVHSAGSTVVEKILKMKFIFVFCFFFSSPNLIKQYYFVF